MIEGFCTLELRNVPIGSNRRCLTDQTFAIAPSTLCAHRQWLGVDGWSACVQVHPCRPRLADAWRAILSQQAKAIQKRDQDRDRADRRFKVAGATPPKLVKARQPQRTIGPAAQREFLCSGCSILGRRRHSGDLCQWCYQTERRRAMGKGSRYRVPVESCPICERPFQARSYGAGKRRKTCSALCKQKRAVLLQQERIAS